MSRHCIGLLTLSLALGFQAFAKDDFVSPELRRELLKKARVWNEVDVSKADLLNGRKDPLDLDNTEEVKCKFDRVNLESTGITPKFYCNFETEKDGKKKIKDYKVKYGRDIDRRTHFNTEVFAEVLSTRLFAALGFGAENSHPAIVRCEGCLKDPYGMKQKAYVDGARETFDPAMIDFKFKGEKIESYDHQGWAWDELDLIDPSQGGSTRAEIDAFKLLAAFVMHYDNKAAQNDFVCQNKDIENLADCPNPFLIVADFGWTFGTPIDASFVASGLSRDRKAANLSEWVDNPVWWGPAKRCVAYLPMIKTKLSIQTTGTLSYPKISEEGRVFLVRLMRQLSRKQIVDLFRGARVEVTDEKIKDPKTGRMRDVTAEDWADAFERKFHVIASTECRE